MDYAACGERSVEKAECRKMQSVEKAEGVVINLPSVIKNGLPIDRLWND